MKTVSVFKRKAQKPLIGFHFRDGQGGAFRNDGKAADAAIPKHIA